MRKKISSLLAVLTMFTMIPFTVYAGSVDDVKEFLSPLDGNGGHFSISEFEPYDGLKILRIVSTVDGEAGNGDTNGFIFGKTDLFKDMSIQDWYDYNYLSEDVYIKGKDEPSYSSLYDFKNDEQNSVVWGFETSVESLSEGKVIKRSGPVEDIVEEETTPYEENTSLHIYQIAEEIIQSNTDTFVLTSEYSADSEEIQIKCDGNRAEVYGLYRLNASDNLSQAYRWCTVFSYENTGDTGYTYDVEYVFIEGDGSYGTYNSVK